jgi:hypothetical protein
MDSSNGDEGSGALFEQRTGRDELQRQRDEIKTEEYLDLHATYEDG